VKDGNASGVAFAPDSRSFALMIGGNPDVRLCDGTTGETRRTLRGHAGEVHALAYRRDGRRLVTAGSDRTVRVWNPDTGEAVHRLEGHNEAVLHVAFAPDGVRRQRGADGTVRLWDANTGIQLGGLRLPR
jgi:WD40 repeat protein